MFFLRMFAQASRIILATDADRPGQALAEDIALHVGMERSFVILIS